MSDSFHDYIQGLMRDGYITDKGAPLKCLFCESNKLAEKERLFIVETIVTCSDCNKEVGHWSYGNWQWLSETVAEKQI